MIVMREVVPEQELFGSWHSGRLEHTQETSAITNCCTVGHSGDAAE